MDELLKQVENLPSVPGVYLFKNDKGVVLYVGKATSLKDRVRSYFREDLLVTRGPKLIKMRSEAVSVDHIETDSVLEALILEANLIKSLEPPYNTDQKDGKSFNYLVIINEDWPRLVTVRGRVLSETFDESEIKYVFGPFVAGGALQRGLKIIRKIFPYRDKCTPAEVQARKKFAKLSKTKQAELTASDAAWQEYVRMVARPCFNYQIGLCPGVCKGVISKKEYARIINHLRLFFEGKKKQLIKDLERDMKDLARELKFEEAERVKQQIFALEHINDVSVVGRDDEIAEKYLDRSEVVRIEAFDIAHLALTSRVGVMVVIEDGVAKKSDYRRFKIRSSKRGDTDALAEVITRRLTHDEWPLPTVLIVDGGEAQLNAAKKVLLEAGVAEKISLVSVVKDERHRPKDILGDTKAASQYEREIILANAESHRFAQNYHQKVRRRRFT